jgi:ribosomal-protein-alanine N-acetyltransferase
MQLNIRPMELKDIPAVHEIDVLSFSLPWPANSFRFELVENPATLLWVAEAPGDQDGALLVGMLVMWVIIDEGHIGTIAVHPDFRRQGIGSRLLTHVIRQTSGSGLKKIYLEVRRSNMAAQKLYEKFGFFIDGVRPRYYRDTNEDAILMTKLVE